MGRRMLLHVGAIQNNFEVVSADSVAQGSNRLIQVRCLTCGHMKSMWNTSFRSGAGKCDYCSAKVNKFYAKLESDMPVIAVYADHLDIHYDESKLPTDSQGLFKMLNATRAVPYLPKDQGSARSVPEPDMGYTYHLKVPTHYVDYYCGISDLPPTAAVNADKFFNEHVCTPHEGAFSEVYKGSGQTWPQEDGNWSYVYWKDRNTWPKSEPTPDSYVPPPVVTVQKMSQEESLAIYHKRMAEQEQASARLWAEREARQKAEREALEASQNTPPSP